MLKQFIKLIGLFVFLLTPLAVNADPISCQNVEGLLNEASKLRGLDKKGDVPCYIWNRDKAKEHLIKTVQEEMPNRRFEYEGQVYQALSLIPDDYNYEQGVISLITNQLAGFYDQRKKFFVMLQEGSEFMQRGVAVHELTHVLQDQHFDIESLSDNKKYNSDALLAHSAVIEGDASAIMYDYNMQYLPQGGIADMVDVQSLMLQSIVGSFLSVELQKAPSSLVDMMLFPYVSGIRFVHHFLHGKGYQEINKLYLEPPQTTEEILHIEKYGKGDYAEFTDDEVLTSFKKNKAQVLFGDVIGEFGISALLRRAKVDNFIEAATGWGGDRVLLIDTQDGKFVLWLTAWDTPKDAEEFYSAYQQIMENLYEKKISQNMTQVTKTKQVQINKDNQRVLLTIKILK